MVLNNKVFIVRRSRSRIEEFIDETCDNCDTPCIRIILSFPMSIAERILVEFNIHTYIDTRSDTIYIHTICTYVYVRDYMH